MSVKDTNMTSSAKSFPQSAPTYPVFTLKMTSGTWETVLLYQDLAPYERICSDLHMTLLDISGQINHMPASETRITGPICEKTSKQLMCPLAVNVSVTKATSGNQKVPSILCLSQRNVVTLYALISWVHCLKMR